MRHPNLVWLPIAITGVSATLWGLYWIPVRYLETLGLPGAWSGIAMNLVAALAVGLWLVIRREPLGLPPRAMLGALLVGVAFSFYSIALAYGDVARVVLLFYLSPVWGKLIEWAFLKMPWAWTTTLALVCALLGAYLVLGGEIAPGSLSLGDWLALLSGLSWAIGATLIFTSQEVPVASLGGATAGSAVLVSLPFAFLDGMPTLAAPGLGAALGLGIVYVLPILATTLWAAQKLAPATLTFLFTIELLAGVVSSALLLDEPFGGMQAAGAALIIFAATSEVLSWMGKRPG